MNSSEQKRSLCSIENILPFIAFRAFFNTRFYYPVFTILFLDFGLSVEQFSLLNTIWAITIVCAEIPSGVLADILGRKKLILATSFLMVIEMALLSFVPLGNSTLIFWAFLLNRICSGLAEAMASGADEAIAYDSLQKHHKENAWPQVLSLEMRIRSIFFVLTMTIGSFLYDPKTVNTLLAWCGSAQVVDQQTTMRFPLYGTLVFAVLATISALRMQETEKKPTKKNFSIAFAVKKTLQAGRWIYHTPFALMVILFGMFFDHILRMIITLTSQYFRLINLPEASFGLIGSAIALLGIFTPKIAEHLADKYSPIINTFIIFAISLTGLAGLAGFYPYWGLFPVALIATGLTFVSFFTSHYLNTITESQQRATVLSFKGLAFNLAYGWIGCAFAGLIVSLKESIATGYPSWSTAHIADQAFKDGIGYFPWYALLFFTVLLLYGKFRRTQESDQN